jgi:hypothetical protein
VILVIHDIEHVQSEVERIARAVGATSTQLPAFARPDEEARPYITVDAAAYHYITEERGVEIDRLTTTSIDDLLYRACSDMTFSLAVVYEGGHRIRGQDSRRLMFDRQIQLIARVSADWAARHAAEHAAILERHPFSR